MRGIKNVFEWSFDKKSRSQVDFVCCTVCIFNYIYIHWHYRGSFKGVPFPKKVRLRSLEIGVWRVPLKEYEI